MDSDMKRSQNENVHSLKEFGPFAGLVEDGVSYTSVILVTFDLERYTLISSQQ